MTFEFGRDGTAALFSIPLKIWVTLKDKGTAFENWVQSELHFHAVLDHVNIRYNPVQILLVSLPL